jgi:APA family basic amino acid/polyamine antiporter
MSPVTIATQHPKRTLLRVLGLGFGIAVVVGGIIGAGILRTPGSIAAKLHSQSMVYLVWALGGLYALVAVNTYAELATSVPKAGGGYVYVNRTYGRFPGFVAGWNDFVINTLSIAYLSVAGGEFLGALIPGLKHWENLLAFLLILSLGILHSFGMRTSSLAQQVSSLLKVLLLAALIAAALLASPAPAQATMHTALIQTPVNLLVSFATAVVAMQMVMETYAGWNAGCYFSEETTNPGRTIPWAMFTGVIVVISLYLLVNMALLHVLTFEELSASQFPTSDAMAKVFGEKARTGVIVLGLIAIAGIVNTGLLFAPRTVYAMARDGLLSDRATYVTAGGTPLVALWMTAAMAAGFSALGSFENLLAVAAFLALIGDALCYTALFVLRKNEPKLPRPFRAIGYPYIPFGILMVACCLVVMYLIGNTLPSMAGLAVLLVAYPIFRYVSRSEPSE